LLAGSSLTFARADVDLAYDGAGAFKDVYRKTDFNSGAFNNFKNFVKTTYAYDAAERVKNVTHTSQRNQGS